MTWASVGLAGVCSLQHYVGGHGMLNIFWVRMYALRDFTHFCLRKSSEQLLPGTGVFASPRRDGLTMPMECSFRMTSCDPYALLISSPQVILKRHRLRIRTLLSSTALGVLWTVSSLSKRACGKSMPEGPFSHY
jgi:hypothetical protein